MNIVIEQHTNGIAIDAHLNQVDVEEVDVETLVHFLAPWQAVHEHREVKADDISNETG